MSDPAIARLVAALPTMSSGKPRRFRLYCECYEWTFNRTRTRYHAPTADLIEGDCRHADRLASALFQHQRDNPGDFHPLARAT